MLLDLNLTLLPALVSQVDRLYSLCIATTHRPLVRAPVEYHAKRPSKYATIFNVQTKMTQATVLVVLVRVVRSLDGVQVVAGHSRELMEWSCKLVHARAHAAHGAAGTEVAGP
jgi:hypothetical protein